MSAVSLSLSRSECSEQNSSLCVANACEFDFETAEVGVEILTDSVGDVDGRTLSELQFGRSCGHTPAHSASGPCAVVGEFEAKVAVLHDARSRHQTRIPRHKDGFGIAVAQGLKLSEPAGEYRGDVVERKLCVDMQISLRLALRKPFRGAIREAALEFGQRFGRKCKADGKCMSTETREEVGACLDGGE